MTVVSGMDVNRGESDSSLSGSAPSFVNSATTAISGELGKRYAIIAPLGAGGMGEVFRAWDRELHRDVAIKIIRSDIAYSPMTLERFRREIKLSSSVTHKNVLRVYDLGEANGRQFLSMQFVDGEDLAVRLRRGRLPLDEALNIFRQVCEGLAAAHQLGVIHRDLKPHNILIDQSGNVFLTDFGLAKMTAEASLTDAGKVMGSPQYMSPEQVQGHSVDHRTDIYSLGLVLYRMLTGELPFDGETPLEVMVQRLRTTPRPVSTLNPDLPRHVIQIIDRCLAIDPDARYASVAEILRDLDEGRFSTSMRFEIDRRRRLLAGVGAVLILAAVAIGGGWAVSRWRDRPDAAPVTGSQQPVKVLIADMQNRTSEPLFDGTMEPVLSLALESAPLINTYSRSQARQLAGKLQPAAKSMDEPLARLIAVREGLSVVIGGSIENANGGYRIGIRAIDPMTGRLITEKSVDADDREEVLRRLSDLAMHLRDALGEKNPAAGAAETFTAASLEAAHDYAAAQELQFAGRFEDAAAMYQRAIEHDPDLGRAYAGLAAVSANLGRRADAENYYRQALQRLARMTDREKYRTRGGYYLLTRNPVKAIDEFSALVRQYPADTAGLNNLALSYFYNRDMPRALEQANRTLEIYPRNVLYRANAALYAMYASDFDAAIQHAQAVLAENPAYLKAYVAVALSQLAQGSPDRAAQTYRKLAGVSDRGASMASTGLADLALYEGRVADAVQILTDGVAADRKRNEAAAAAEKTAMLASAHLAAGNRAAALSSAREAAAAAARSADEALSHSAARVLIELDQADEALQLAGRLEERIDDEGRLYGRLIRGELELRRGAARTALDRFREAQQLGDSWLGRFGLGRSYLALGAAAEAHSEFEACVRRRGEAAAVYLNDRPTMRKYPPLVYYVARSEEALGMPTARDTYRRFIQMRRGGQNDPLVADARQRAAR